MENYFEVGKTYVNLCNQKFKVTNIIGYTILTDLPNIFSYIEGLDKNISFEVDSLFYKKLKDKNENPTLKRLARFYAGGYANVCDILDETEHNDYKHYAFIDEENNIIMWDNKNKSALTTEEIKTIESYLIK